MSMQANLQWIQREWNKWVDTDRAKRISASGDYKLGVQHVAKLFAAHCVEALQNDPVEAQGKEPRKP